MEKFEKKMNKMEHGIKSGAFIVPIVLGGVLLFGLALMLLWNSILPDVLGVKSISFLQAMGIFILSKILFGFNKGWGGRRGQWKQRMDEKWHAMTPEEREKFKSEWKNRCGGRWGRYEQPDAGTMSTETGKL